MSKDNALKGMFEVYLEQVKSTPFSGWNFDYLTKTGRMVEAPLKWNYYNIVFPYLSKAETMLDMGTGGGEVLSEFLPLPPNTYATEQYKPNVSVARERLGPLGVTVVEVEEEKSPPYNANLPFDDEFFDLIIHRHESYYPPELKRILKPRGLFITEQVGQGLWNLKKALTGKEGTKSDWNLETLVVRLKSAGFRILDAREDIQFIRLYDIGAIAYWLKAVPWIIEDVTGVQDFSVEKYKDRLWELHRQIEKDGFYDCSYAVFIIVANK